MKKFGFNSKSDQLLFQKLKMRWEIYFTERTSQLVENTSGKKNSTATPQLQTNTESDIDDCNFL
jgi:hypothetical protein